MKVSKAVKLRLEYHKSHSRENTVREYVMILTQLCEEFENESLEDITTERILSFLNRVTEGKKQQTKQTRYSLLLAFFNFFKNHIDPDFKNPCDPPMLKKVFKARPSYHWNIIEKETVDEVIFRTSKPRNRLILELMARGGMRISEVLKLTPSDIHERRLTQKEPKSGREQEFIFLGQRFEQLGLKEVFDRYRKTGVKWTRISEIKDEVIMLIRAGFLFDIKRRLDLKAYSTTFDEFVSNFHHSQCVIATIHEQFLFDSFFFIRRCRSINHS